MTQRSKRRILNERKQLYDEVVKAFESKYHWLGHQAAREMLLSAASWNLEQYSNPPFRYRSHLMFAWERGYFKSTLLRKMAHVLGDEMCSVMGKVTDAAMRGSLQGKTFTPPKPLRTPIVISTEFGQTDFEGELLNLFHNLLEEGHGNVSMNKIGALGESQRKSIEKNYNGKIQFKETNEFDLFTDFVFWGATYDPSKLEDDALRSRFNVVTPAQPLDHRITETADNSKDVMKQLDKTTIRDVRRALKSKKEMSTDFRPPSQFYKEYNLIPRESRDIQSYMACRNWWGLDTNPEIMKKYIEYLQKSRRMARKQPREIVFDIIFDNPTTYGELTRRTGLSSREIYKIMQYELRADTIEGDEGETKWVIWSGDKNKGKLKSKFS